MVREGWSSDSTDLLAAYAKGPDLLRQALAALDDGVLDFAHPQSGGWTIRQIVHHLADGDSLWMTCIQAALGASANSRSGDVAGRIPFQLQWYWDRPQDEWARCWAYSDRPIEPSLTALAANRQRTVQLLRHVEDALANRIRVRWPSGQEQEVTVAWVVEMQSRHISGHIEDIARICEAHDKPGV